MIVHSPLVSVLIPPYNVEKSEIESDFEIAYLNAAKKFYDKAPYNQYDDKGIQATESEANRLHAIPSVNPI